MAIPYQTTKSKSANIFAMAIWSPSTKFNSYQYFQLYSNYKQLTLSQQTDGEYGLGNPKSTFVHLCRVKSLSRRAYAEFTIPMSTERKVDGYCNKIANTNNYTTEGNI